MAGKQVAEIVTKISADASQFNSAISKSSSTAAKFAKQQKGAANDSVFSSNKMSQAFRQAANSAATLSGPMGGVASRLGTVSTGFGSVGIAATSAGLAITGLSVLVGLATAKFAELEKRTLRTEALFKSTSGAAGLTTKELNDLANTVAENTLASVSGVTSAINVLQTFKSISGEAFTDAIELSQDLAAVMGGDIRSSALQLGKALEDPITGLTALRRSGVSFTTAQKELIQSFVDTGQTASAQALILETLRNQVGGAGAAEGGGLSGATDLLGQRWDELLEAFAKTSGVGTGTTSALNAISGALASITDVLGGGDELERLNKELEYTQQLLSSANVTGSWREEIEAQRDGILSQIDAINQRANAEKEVIAEGKRLQQELAAEQKAAAERQVQEQGAVRLRALERQFATEKELVILQWEDRNTAFEALVLSEEEIRKRGFDNMLDLQRDYVDKSSALAADQLFQIEERQRQEIQAAKDKKQSEEKIKEEEERAKQRIAGDAFVQNLNVLATQNKKFAGIAKAAAIAQATIKTYESATSAYAALATIPFVGPALGIAAATAAIAAGLANVAAIRNTPIAGAREMGGPVSGGKTYLVGEKGPELFTPNATGQITSNDNLKRSLNGSSGNNISINLSVNSRRPADILEEVNSIKRPLVRMLQSTLDKPI